MRRIQGLNAVDVMDLLKKNNVGNYLPEEGTYHKISADFIYTVSPLDNQLELQLGALIASVAASSAFCF